MKRKLFIALSAMIFATNASVNAQESSSEYIFQPHAYLQVQGGAQYTLGESDFSEPSRL